MNGTPSPEYLAAYGNAFACAVSSWSESGNPVPTFYNTAQTYAFVCPDGLVFYYTVAGGLFPALSQAEANAAALSYAELLAGQHAICLSGIPTAATMGVPYSAVIEATGESLAVAPTADTWSFVGGMLPPGLTLAHGAFINGQAMITGGQCPLTGTPTLAGNYSFTLRVTDPDGDSMQKTFNILVAI
jgi:hypothetical protein